MNAYLTVVLFVSWDLFHMRPLLWNDRLGELSLLKVLSLIEKTQSPYSKICIYFVVSLWIFCNHFSLNLNIILKAFLLGFLLVCHFHNLHYQFGHLRFRFLCLCKYFCCLCCIIFFLFHLLHFIEKFLIFHESIPSLTSKSFLSYFFSLFPFWLIDVSESFLKAWRTTIFLPNLKLGHHAADLQSYFPKVY